MTDRYADKSAAWLRSALLMQLGDPDARDGWALYVDGDEVAIYERRCGNYMLTAELLSFGCQWDVRFYDELQPIEFGECPTLMEAADAAEAALARLLEAT